MMNEPERAQLDEAALERLRELDPDGRHGVLLRVMRAFENSLQAMLAQLAAPAGPGQAKVLADVAHKLKSSAASVGALALSRLCTEIELRQRTDPGESVDEDVRRLITEGERALAAVRAMLQA